MSNAVKRTLIMDPKDSVALCLVDIEAGDYVQTGSVQAQGSIPSGHKIAVRSLMEGEAVIKFGQVIGQAAQPIAAGEHVHVHNVRLAESAMERERELAAPPIVEKQAEVFQGYLRPDGRVATRNYIGILTSVNCSATVARRIADSFPDARFSDQPEIDGVVALTHTTGCGMTSSSEGRANLQRTLEGYARHPNFAGVLVIGLGCEVMQTGALFEGQPPPWLKTLIIQESGGTLNSIEAGIQIVEDMIAGVLGQQRQTLSAEHLVLGLQCGGSDGWSGVTANPALGRAADRLVAAGGTVILSETPEIYGAEQLLFRRAASADVRTKLLDRLNWWKSYTAKNDAELNNNPSPGNISGGLTTILEKSLGAVAKSGTTPLEQVYDYAEPVDRKGFVFMDSPGYDPCSATGQMAAGANLLAFTTGRGSVFGSKPAPCIKLSSNRATAERMSEDMDIDCSPVLEGTSLDEMGEIIFQRLLALASGEASKSECLGLGDLEFVPWQIGAVM